VATIEDLVSLVPPPTAPVDGDGDWQRVEAALRLRLPTDFKLLMRRYGFGEFADITLFTPFDTHTDGAYDLVERARSLVDRYKSLRGMAPGIFPFPLYPEPGGLLEWAITSEGASLCWLTEGEADEWPVAVWNAAVPAGNRYEMGAVELLHGYLSGQQKMPLLGTPPSAPWFESYRERFVVFLQLSKSELPYRKQLKRLREVLAPTVDRGSVKERKRRADYFKAIDRDWLLMFEDHYGYRICLEVPPEDEDRARAVIFEAVQAMGSQVLAATRNASPIWLDGDVTT
jgi:SMI1-KNR4 cell-wall